MASLGTTGASAELLARVRGARLPPPVERKRIRTAAGVTLREMASVLDVTPMTVLRWERGEVRPASGHALAYRELLDGLKGAVR